MSHAITVLPSNREFTAHDDETVLMAAIRQGIGLPYGCKDGACGSCKCKKISGEVRLDAYQAKALSEAELADGFILTCRAHAQSDLVLESRQVVEAGAFPIRKMPARVASLERLAPDVMRVKLQLPATEAVQYHAGQYMDVLLRSGERRSYSMGNAPHTVGNEQKAIELHIRHMPGGQFTDHVFGAMKEKEIMRIEGPFGSFFLREDSDKPIILLASGTGFAPIKALLEHMTHKGITRPTHLYWGGRRPQDLYLSDWVQAFAQAHPWLSYVPVISDALPEDAWQGRTGFVHRAVLADHPDLSGHEVYACGAPVVINAAQRDFVSEARLDAEAFYADAFTSAADQAQA